MHEAMPSTYAKWLNSAYKQLRARHEDLHEMSVEVRALERAAREMRSIVALHRWSGGNAAYLTRKLNSLILILEQLEPMTAFEDEQKPLSHSLTQGEDEITQEVDPPPAQIPNSRHNSPSKRTEDFPSFIITFATWLMEVQHIWAERDEATLDTTQDFDRFRTVDSLGDEFKASLRNLTANVVQLSTRLEDLRGTDRTRSPERFRHAQQKPIPAREDPAREEEADEEANILLLTKLVFQLVEGMREELQIIREIEFEVMEGERAWLTR